MLDPLKLEGRFNKNYIHKTRFRKWRLRHIDVIKKKKKKQGLIQYTSKSTFLGVIFDQFLCFKDHMEILRGNP